MKIKRIFLFFSIIFACITARSQSNLLFNTNNIASKNLFSISMKDSTKSISPSMLVSPLFYCNNLGFICKQEIKFQKIIKVPFVFRLGSLQYVNYLEGKKGALVNY
jgi:hypothetical protein